MLSVLGEALLMSTHNICFLGEIRKILYGYPLLSVAMSIFSDLIIPGLVTNGTAKICCRGLILVLFNSTMVIKNGFE